MSPEANTQPITPGLVADYKAAYLKTAPNQQAADDSPDVVPPETANVEAVPADQTANVYVKALTDPDAEWVHIGTTDFGTTIYANDTGHCDPDNPCDDCAGYDEAPDADEPDPIERKPLTFGEWYTARNVTVHDFYRYIAGFDFFGASYAEHLTTEYATYLTGFDCE